MNFKLLLNIAVHLLRARLKQSVVAAVGVTFGIAMFISLVSFMNGLNDLLDGLMLNRTPHVRLYNEIKPAEKQAVYLSKNYRNNVNIIRSIKPKDRGKAIYNCKAIMHQLKADPRVIDVAPKITEPMFFNSGTIEIAGVVNGIDVAAEEKLFQLSDYLVEGSIQDLHQNNSIILGKGLADKMLVHVGDVIQLTSPKGNLSSLKVVGISQFGIAEFDDTTTFTSLETAQKHWVNPPTTSPTFNSNYMTSARHQSWPKNFKTPLR